MNKKKITDDRVDEIVGKEVLTEEDVETLTDWVLQEFEDLDTKPQ